MSQEYNDPIEALLRKQFDGPVPDGGFSQRVMQHVPARRRRAMWPLWSGVLLGALACWLALLPSPLLHAAWRDVASGHWSAPAITVLLAMFVLTMLALGWSVAEAEER